MAKQSDFEKTEQVAAEVADDNKSRMTNGNREAGDTGSAGGPDRTGSSAEASGAAKAARTGEDSGMDEAHQSGVLGGAERGGTDLAKAKGQQPPDADIARR
jgi:hypothetical protein